MNALKLLWIILINLTILANKLVKRQILTASRMKTKHQSVTNYALIIQSFVGIAFLRANFCTSFTTNAIFSMSNYHYFLFDFISEWPEFRWKGNSGGNFRKKGIPVLVRHGCLRTNSGTGPALDWKNDSCSLPFRLWFHC